ncbi:MAG: DegT/DnrJ/EryC1/StrS family aminotransferase [Betaproteobacteria bacterium]|nr:DegT/DnrJ/EryC1/StrS family aminotransferase [Betaproteobacteria bacterium]
MQFVDLALQYRALKESIDARMQAVLDHGRYIMGPEVEELEGRLAEFTGANHCVTCSSGTEALLISLMALGVSPGDEVITTPFTFVATAEMIVLLGARPVLVDIQAGSFNLDQAGIEAAITQRTKAIMPVSLFGQTADMDEINAIAAKHGLAVVEDAAQSLGARYRGRLSGNLSTIGCTSFFPSKPLGCYGDGGAIFTSDGALANAMREIRVHGQERRYVHTRIGVGGRMDTLQCAVVLAKLDRFEWEIAQRGRLGARYSGLFAASEFAQYGIVAPPIAADRTSVYAQYTLRTPQRDALGAGLKRLGVPTAVHYPLSIHRQPAYSGFHDGRNLPVADKAALEVISLPMYPDMDAATQDRIVAAVKETLAKLN